MRYIFVNDGDKEALFKRYYRRFQVICGTAIAALIIFMLLFRSWFLSHAGWCVLIFVPIVTGAALYLRSCAKRDGVDFAELRAYTQRQPMMVVVKIVMIITIIISIYKMIFPS
jgi:hypothetical protein